MSSHTGSDSDDIEQLLDAEPIYHVLGEFLKTDDQKNIATVISEVKDELSNITEQLKQLVEILKSKQ